VSTAQVLARGARALVRAGALRPVPPSGLVAAARRGRSLAAAVAAHAARDPGGVALVDDRGP
jgi:hypothetical protein